MALDAVCGRRVRQRSNRNLVEYAGERYFFCSPECLQRFDAQPDLFTFQPGEGKLVNRDRYLLPGHGASFPRQSSLGVLEAADSDAGPG